MMTADGPPAAVAATEPGSAPGWPLVLYFHHVTEQLTHYSALTPASFRRALGTALDIIGPPVDPATIGPQFKPPAHPTVLVTFDDGYRSVLTHAAPILREFGVGILLFCVTGRLAPANSRPGGDLDYLSWRDIAELTTAGHVASAHTVSHQRLTAMPAAQARTEVGESLAAVRDQVGYAPATFAYPYGIVPDEPILPTDVLGFATVRVPRVPWTQRPHHIRRNYLPTGAEDQWRRLCQGWRAQWYESV